MNDSEKISKITSMYISIKKSGNKSGQINCNLCSGTVNYRTVSNGHIRAACTTCDFSMME